VEINAKQTLTTFAVILALVSAVWGFDSHFVPKSLFEITLTGFQGDRAKENAYRDIQFWTQQEAAIANMLALTPPGSPRFLDLQRQLETAVREKAEAIRYWNSLKK